MCGCKKDIESRLLDRFRKDNPAASDHSAELKGYGMAVIDNTMQLLGVMPIELSAAYPMKGGTLRKQKKTKQIMFFNYCPFCGEKVSKGGA